MEKLCQYHMEDFGLETHVARAHNVYGPLGSYDGGREKAPAAICRKVALAKTGGTLEVWGDGKQTRSFMYVDDCVEGLHRLMRLDSPIPLNLDTGQMVTLDELVRVVAKVAGKAVRIRHNRSMPQGARDCNSDGALLRHVLRWEPQVSLAEGWHELTLGSPSKWRSVALVSTGNHRPSVRKRAPAGTYYHRCLGGGE